MLIDFKTKKPIVESNVPNDALIDRFKLELDGLLEQYNFNRCGFVFVFVQDKDGELFPDVITDTRFIDKETMLDVVVQCAECALE